MSVPMFSPLPPANIESKNIEKIRKNKLIFLLFNIFFSYIKINKITTKKIII